MTTNEMAQLINSLNTTKGLFQAVALTLKNWLESFMKNCLKNLKLKTNAQVMDKSPYPDTDLCEFLVKLIDVLLVYELKGR